MKTSQTRTYGVLLTSTLSTLVRDNPCAYALIGAVARKYPSNRAISAWEAKVVMQAERETYTEDEAAQCMRVMETHGLGYVRQDAGNGDFGFVWALLPIIAYELIRAGQPAIPDGFVRFTIAEGDVDEWPGMLTVHKFQLRSNCAVTLELPSDLTYQDVKKLKRVLKALAADDSDDSNDGPAWDFPTTSDHVEDDFPEVDGDKIGTEDIAGSLVISEADAVEFEDDDNFLLPMSVMEDPVLTVQSLLKKKKAKKRKRSKTGWRKF
jgi:hypothetical protein